MKKLFYSLMATAIALCTFNSCEDVPEPYKNPYDQSKIQGKTVVDPKGTGTEADPYNVAAALEKCAEVGETGTTEDVYAVGYVVSISEISTQYGNATFKIADSAEGGDALTVYRAKGLKGESITDEKIIKNGDKVVICGKLVNFKGNTPEFTQGCYIVSINGEGGGGEKKEETIGTKENPKTVADALTAINALEDNATTAAFYFVKGKVKTVKTTDDNITKYKNIDYIIVDEGQDNELTVFRGKYLENADFTTENKVKEGDVVTVYGQLTKYVKEGTTTPEVAAGNYLVTIVSGGDTPTPTPTPTGDNLLTNGDFETWAGGAPANWNGQPGNGTLSQSTDKHAGSYAVQIKGTSKNTRIAYKAITLKAGTYSMNFYAKGVADGASARPGYVAILADGSTDSQNYKYGEYTNDITASTWAEISHNFTLAEQTKLCLVVMNPKDKGDLLIDDFTLTTSDGGIVEGGEGGGEGGGETTTSELGTADAPINVAQALAEINKLEDGQSTATEAYVKGKISQIKGFYSNSVITYWISEDGTQNNELQIYNGKNINGTNFSSKDDLAVGQEVVVKGQLMKYVNKSGVMTPEINGGVLVSIQ